MLISIDNEIAGSLYCNEKYFYIATKKADEAYIFSEFSEECGTYDFYMLSGEYCTALAENVRLKDIFG